MAIAFDSQSTVNATTGTSLTFAFNNVAGDFIVVAGHNTDAGASVVTGVTYNSVALVAGPTVQTPSDRWNTIHYWDSASPPSTGSNNVVVSASGSTPLRYSAYSYSGVNYDDPLTGGTDTSTGSGVTTINTDITTVADNAWMFMFIKDNSGGKTASSSTGDTVRMTTDAGGQSVADTGGAITPAAATTMTLSWSGSTNVGALAIAFKPTGGATGPANLKSLDTNVKANIKSYNTNVLANIKSINTNA